MYYMENKTCKHKQTETYQKNIIKLKRDESEKNKCENIEKANPQFSSFFLGHLFP